MKILTVVGARPQFIKAAVVSRALKLDQDCTEILVHTGQHYDYNMSDIFFNELDIPKPKYNLGVSGGSHASMTGMMLIEIEKVLLLEKPKVLLVYGDTNSTLAAALAAVKLGIPVCHVEAGNRLGTLTNPEEVNRICTDHVSSLLMCCTKSSVEFLKKEGKENNVYLVGDPMLDAFEFYSQNIKTENTNNITALDGSKVEIPEAFYYLTCHRQENTLNESYLIEILSAMNELDAKTIYPVHPRNKAVVKNLLEKYGFRNILAVEPVGYLTSIALVKKSKKILTDSGGVQREAFFAKVQCVTIFDYIIWPETMIGNQNQLAKPNRKDILEKLHSGVQIDENYKPFGDGNSAKKIIELIKKHI